MRQFFGTVLCMCMLQAGFGQFTIKGKIISEENKEGIESATISLLYNGNILSSQASHSDGSFQFNNIRKKDVYELVAEHVSYERKDLLVQADEASPATVVMLKKNVHFLEALEVKAVRASDKAPFAKTNLTAQDLAASNIGQDLPFLLNQTPSVVINSDAGNGIGYTGMRIRGSDATRINVTLNGIPYNDAESQGTYFVDLPDIASSINSIQIQRGVGSSSNGAGAFGATISLSTNEFVANPSAEISNSYGSFNSWKNTVKVSSGLLNNHFTVDMRLSHISSDGFIDRASTNLRSLYLSTAYINKKSTLRLNYISGAEKTYQAWYGIPEAMLETNRTYNIAGTEKAGEPYDNETDNYRQDHYQLFFNHSLTDNVTFNTAFFLTPGKGYYEQYKADQSFGDYHLAEPVINGAPVPTTDLVRQLWLDNKYYGQIFSVQYKKHSNQVTLGGGWNKYSGDHFGKVIWAATGIAKDYEWYRLDAVKTDVNVYSKWQHSINRHVELYADVQYRHVGYVMNGFENNPAIIVDRKFNFINPKAGISYQYHNSSAFFSYAMSNKEPNRDDFEAGVTQQPKHETLHDFEAGFETRGTYFTWGATGYYMLYKNQLILTGQINDVGAYTRVNVPNSYRLGVELQSKATITKWLNALGNIALSRNKIKNSAEFLDDYDNGGQVKVNHNNTAISFSPAVVGGLTVNFIPVKNGEISLVSKYVSRQYLDNTEDISRSLKPYYVQDVRLSYRIKNKVFNDCSIVAAVYNVFDKKYEPNGYTFSYIYGGQTTTENYYLPMAGTNYMAGVSIKL